MPPTVKSLEERIDEMASDLDGLKRQTVSNNAKVDAKLDLMSSQLATVIANQTATQNQLSITIVRLDGAVEALKATNVRIDATNARLDRAIEKLDGMNAEMAAIATKGEATATKAAETAGKVDVLATEHAAVKATAAVTESRAAETVTKLETHTAELTKITNSVAFPKWIAVFSAGAFFTVLVAAFGVARTAGHFEARLENQQKLLDEIKRDLTEIRTRQK